MYYYGIRERRRSFYDSIKQTIAWPLANQQRPPSVPVHIWSCKQSDCRTFQMFLNHNRGSFNHINSHVNYTGHFFEDLMIRIME